MLSAARMLIRVMSKRARSASSPDPVMRTISSYRCRCRTVSTDARRVASANDRAADRSSERVLLVTSVVVSWDASSGSARPVIVRSESHGSVESRSATSESKALVAAAPSCSPA